MDKERSRVDYSEPSDLSRAAGRAETAATARATGMEKWRVFLAGLAVFAATLPVLAQEEGEDETPTSSAGGGLLDDELTVEPTLRPEPSTPTPTITPIPTPTRLPTAAPITEHNGDWAGTTSQARKPILITVRDNAVHAVVVDVEVVTNCGSDFVSQTLRPEPPAVITDGNFSLSSTFNLVYAGVGYSDPYLLNLGVGGRFDSPSNASGNLDIVLPHPSARGCQGSVGANWNANKR